MGGGWLGLGGSVRRPRRAGLEGPRTGRCPPLKPPHPQNPRPPPTSVALSLAQTTSPLVPGMGPDRRAPVAMSWGGVGGGAGLRVV